MAAVTRQREQLAGQRGVHDLDVRANIELVELEPLAHALRALAGLEQRAALNGDGAAIAQFLAVFLDELAVERHLALGRGKVDALPAEGAEYDRLDRLRDRKSTRLNSSHVSESRMPSSA